MPLLNSLTRPANREVAFVSPSSATLSPYAPGAPLDSAADGSTAIAQPMMEIWNRYLDELEASMREVAHALATDAASFDRQASLDIDGPPEGTMPPDLAPRASALVERMTDLSRCVEDEMQALKRRRSADRPRTIPIYIDSRF